MELFKSSSISVPLILFLQLMPKINSCDDQLSNDVENLEEENKNLKGDHKYLNEDVLEMKEEMDQTSQTVKVTKPQSAFHIFAERSSIVASKVSELTKPTKKEYSEYLEKLEFEFQRILPLNPNMKVVLSQLAVCQADKKYADDCLMRSKKDLDAERELTTELKVLLGFGTEIEELELFLWPVNITKPNKGRADTWEQILASTANEFINSGVIMEFCDRLANEKISIDFFIKQGVCKFYERSSALAVHKMKFPDRSTVTEKVIEKVLDKMGLPTHNLYIKSFKVLLQPLKSLN